MIIIKPCMRCWAAIAGIVVVVAAKMLGLDGATVEKLANIVGLTVGAFGLEHVVKAARGDAAGTQSASGAHPDGECGGQ